MKALTRDQIYQAAKLWNSLMGMAKWGDLPDRNKNAIYMAMERIAPLLQIAWDEPTNEELLALFSRIRATMDARDPSLYCVESIRVAIQDFVYRRNAILSPKLDDRREKLKAAIRQKITLGVQFHRTEGRSYDQAAEEIMQIFEREKS